MHTWPPNPPRRPERVGAGARVDVDPEVQPETACKHGLGACERCGTTDARDALHTTERGVGRVGRIR